LGDALEMINKAVSKNPNRPTYLDTKGWVLYQLGRYDDAIGILEKAYNHFRRDSEVGMHYIKCLEKLGRTQEADKIRNEISQVN